MWGVNYLGLKVWAIGMSQKKKTITISEERHSVLSALREKNETFDGAVGWLLESYSSKSEALPQNAASAPDTALSEEVRVGLDNLRMEGECLNDVVKMLLGPAKK